MPADTLRIDANLKRREVKVIEGRLICAELGCNKPIHARGLCKQHYDHERRSKPVITA